MKWCCYECSSIMSLVNSHVLTNDVRNDNNDIAGEQDDAVSSQVRGHALIYLAFYIVLVISPSELCLKSRRWKFYKALGIANYDLLGDVCKIVYRKIMPYVFYAKVRTVQQVIRLTSENLEELDRHFKGIRHPPSMFLEVCWLGFLPVSVVVLKICKYDVHKKATITNFERHVFFKA